MPISDVAGLKAALLATVDQYIQPEPQPVPSRKVGYFTSWSVYDSYFLRDVDKVADRLTHIVYCFGAIDATTLRVKLGDPWADVEMGYSSARSVDGVADVPSQALKGHFNQLRKLKARHPHLRVLVALGGPGQQAQFAQAAATAQSRAAFVSSVVDVFLHGNVPGLPVGAAAGIFDGFDLDWEFPLAADTANLTALITECRSQLDVFEIEFCRPDLELTAWVPANKQWATYWSDAELDKFSFIVVQGYDLHGPWEGTTNYTSALDTDYPDKTWFTCHQAVTLWLSKGVSARDLVLGVPFYCNGWANVAPGPNGDGLWQPGTGISSGSMYRAVVAARGVMSRKVGMGASKYNAAGRIFYSVDDAGVMADKAAYLVNKGLGGFAAWELRGDTPDAVLLSTLSAGLGKGPRCTSSR
ncbi:glycoside hydrolase family 18 protein [Saccharopolyspora shandongensis]|uniref:glycoside hydrolase family 18 protein n=1 Tax=Saccharopolyspora shandongensis TaxID=418495 RepID=UPI0033E93367